MQNHFDIMHASKFFALLLFVVSCGVEVELRGAREDRISDPWRQVREECRKECGLTRVDLLKLENNMQSARSFLWCFAQKLGNVNDDGSVNGEAVLKNISPMTPITIARPMLNCCVDQVYKGRLPRNQDEAAMLFTNAIICWKDLLPSSMWQIIGTFSPPIYPRLDKCYRPPTRRW